MVATAAVGMRRTEMHSCYRPQRSCGQGYVFTCVCDSVNRRGVCLSACWDNTPLGADPPGADIPRSRHPLGADPPGAAPWKQTLPRSRHSPPSPQADTGIRSMSGRYASYWNALSFWTNDVTNFCHFRFSIFVLETLKFEWQNRGMSVTWTESARDLGDWLLVSRFCTSFELIGERMKSGWKAKTFWIFVFNLVISWFLT